VGVGVALLAIAGMAALAFAGRSSSPKFSAELRPPLKVGQVVMVTYTLPRGLTLQQGAALLSFVMQWGRPLRAPTPGTMVDGTQTLSIVVRVEVEQPQGPPQIPSEKGNLTPVTWQETADTAGTVAA
jgi:hypothetical protein